ncbi:MAG: DUF7544 domain-containing protein [Halobacteriota archaeon]
MESQRPYAVEALFDSVYHLRYYFVPFELRRYAALVLITSVVGARAGYGAVGDGLALAAGVELDVRLTKPAAETMFESTGLYVAGGAVLLVFILYVSALFEFVFVEVLRTDERRLKRHLRRHRLKAASLAVFRGIATLGFVLTSLAAVEAYRLSRSAFGGFLGIVVLVGLLAFAFSLVNGLTTDFVVPMMVVDRRGLVASWVELLEVARHDVRQLLVYVAVRLVINAVILSGAALASLFLGGFLGLPLAGLGYGLGLLSGDAALEELAGVLLVVVLVVLYVALLLATLALFVQLPAKLLMRSYPLYVLGYLDEGYRTLDPRPSGISTWDFLLGRR